MKKNAKDSPGFQLSPSVQHGSVLMRTAVELGESVKSESNGRQEK